jgi:2-polyprenyl-3-methyl-5-hydroxy-6-metoxy-1,4-benzoquinol methylase
MGMRAYQEAIWETVPEGAEPEGFAVRRSFLLRNVAPGERVLDVGCGEGAFSAELQHAGARVVGVDVAREPLARASRLHPDLDLRLVDPDGDWGLELSSFDAVWAGEVIEHVADATAWLSQVRSLLRSGGRLILTTPENGPLTFVWMALSRRAFQTRMDPRSDHLRFYNGRTMSGLLSDFGFESIAVSRAGGLPGARRHLLVRATRSRY